VIFKVLTQFRGEDHPRLEVFFRNAEPARQRYREVLEDATGKVIGGALVSRANGEDQLLERFGMSIDRRSP
jgi:hypothetical protein